VTGLSCVFYDERFTTQEAESHLWDAGLSHKRRKERRDRVLEAARVIPLEALGTTDDCGFSPFADDTSTTRDTAFAKLKSRVEGTLMASNILKV